MSIIVGKDKLMSAWLSAFNRNNFPNCFILTAPQRYGKKFLIRELGKRVGMFVVEPQDLKVDSIRRLMEEAQALSAPTIFFIPDADLMNTQGQNAILKFAEEPNRNAYVILSVSNMEAILPTIRSRAQLCRLAPYTREEVSKFCDNDEQAGISDSPGQAMFWKEKKHILDLAKKLSQTIEKVNYANLFKIPTYLDIPTESEAFCEALMYYFGVDRQPHKSVSEIYQLLSIVSKHKGLLQNKSLNKENTLCTMLIKMREEFA